MPAYHDEESFMQALDNGLIDQEEAFPRMKHTGPIIDLTHLAEDPEPEDNTNEPDHAAAQSPAQPTNKEN